MRRLIAALSKAGDYKQDSFSHRANQWLSRDIAGRKNASQGQAKPPSSHARRAPARTTLSACVLLIAFGFGSADANPYFDAGKAHHTVTGFKNNYADNVDRPLSELLRWQWEAMIKGVPKPPQQPTPAVQPNLALIQSGPALPALTWIGHATLLVQANGLNVLTDPIFSERAFPVQLIGPKRASPPGVAIEDLPAIDVVLISHNHFDHLDRQSVVALDYRAKSAGRSTLFIVPLGIKPWLIGLGISNVVELDWWQFHTVQSERGLQAEAPGIHSAPAGPVEFHLTPVQHWSARGLNDRRETLWGGWAVLGQDFHWYYAGDSGYSRDFADTRSRFAPRQTAAAGGGFDVALIPIGAYEPRWFMKAQHLDPAEAVRVHKDLGAKRSVAVHWGTFSLTDEPLDQPPRDLALARIAQDVSSESFFLMQIGETRILPARAFPGTLIRPIISP